MFFLIKLKETKQKTIIPLKWIKNFDVTMFFNYGMPYHKKKKYIIFFSNDLNDDPDFNAPLKNTLDGFVKGCYEASLIKHFSKFVV